MKLSIIIVNWNTKDLLKQTLDSIFAETSGFDFEVIVVDNASQDSSASMVKERFPTVNLIVNQDNFGFSKANNIGLQASQGEYLMFLNSDVIIKNQAFNKLVDFLDTNQDVDMVGPKLIDQLGKWQEACFRNLPDPKKSFKYLFKLDKIFSSASDYKPKLENSSHTMPAQGLSGAAMMFRQKVFAQIGGLDERFFMYGEDLDFCKRVLDAGFKTMYFGKAEIIHLGGESAKQRKYQSLKNFYSAMWLYYKKYFADNSNFLFNFLAWMGIQIRFFIALVFNVFK